MSPCEIEKSVGCQALKRIVSSVTKNENCLINVREINRFCLQKYAVNRFAPPFRGVRFSVMFHFKFVHYTFSSVWVAEWPPFGK